MFKSLGLAGALAAGFVSPGRAAPAASLDEVVVSAAPYPVTLDSVTTHVEILNRDALDVAPTGGLGDTLATLPGLRSSAYGPGASRPIVRGLSGPRVMVLENGVGMIDASALSPDHAVAADPGAASRIEVLRGPFALAYGGSGVGGVVNVIDDRVPSRRPKDGLEGRLTGSISSADDGRAVSGGVTLGPGPFVFALEGAARRSGDYVTPKPPLSDSLAAAMGVRPDPSRKQFNAAVELETAGAGVSYVGDDGFVGLSVKRTATVYGVPYAQTAVPDPDAEGPVSIDLRQTRFDLRAEGPAPVLGRWFERAKASVGWADYEHVESASDTRETHTRFLSSGLEGRLELVQRPSDGHQGAIGVQALRRDFDAQGEEAFVPPVKISEQGVFVLQRWPGGRFGLDAGVRLDRRRLATRETERDFTNTSASAGVSFQPAAPWFLALSLSHNQRAPTEFELFADGPHPGTGGYEVGDAALSSEKVTSVEFTARYGAGPLRVEGHLFAAHYDGYIEETATGAVEDGLPVFQFAQSRADFRGAEFEASLDLWRNGERSLAAELDGDIVRGSTDRGVPPRIPPWSATGRLIWTTPSFKVTAEARHVADQTRLAINELPTDGFTLVNLRVEARAPVLGGARVFLEGRNLTDVEAREHVSFLKDIAPAAGRSVRLGVGYRF